MSRLLNQDEIPKFRALTDEYQPNTQVLERFRSSKFAIIAGPSGAGKDTLRNLLLTAHPRDYQIVLSTTTRPTRAGEVDGVDYLFRSIEEVEQSLSAREYFQTALVHDQQISCLHIDEINKLEADQTGLSILIVQTEQQLSALKDDIKTIFLIPPDIKTLRQRLSLERPLGNAEIERRMRAGANELNIALTRQDYYCLISGEKEQLCRRAHDFLQNSARDEEADKTARQTALSILNMLSI